jgi:hypothetical protein
MSIQDFVSEYSTPGYFDLNAFTQTHGPGFGGTLPVNLDGITSARCYLLDSKNYGQQYGYSDWNYSWSEFWGMSTSNLGIRLNNGTTSSYTTLFAGYPNPQTAPSSTIGSLPYVDFTLNSAVTSIDIQATFTWDCSYYYSDIYGNNYGYQDAWSTTVDTADNNYCCGGNYINFYSVPELGSNFILGSAVSDPYMLTYNWGPEYSDMVFLLEGNPGGAGSAVPEPHTYLLVGTLLAVLFACRCATRKKPENIDLPK